MNTKSRPARCAMFARSPVSRLSTPITEQSRSSSASARCDPMNPAAPVMTMRFFMYESRRTSEGLTLQNAAEERHPHDLQIERDRPVFDVVEIELDAFFERGVAAPAVHLRPAGNAGFHLVAEHVLREAMLELIDKERPLGPRPNNGHVAFEDVPDLRKLIQIRAPQKPSHRRASRVVV